MLEEVRDIENHLVCCVDSSRGLIEHRYQKEMVRISLPVGGEVLFIRGGLLTLIRRVNPQAMRVARK